MSLSSCSLSHAPPSDSSIAEGTGEDPVGGNLGGDNITELLVSGPKERILELNWPLLLRVV